MERRYQQINIGGISMSIKFYNAGLYEVCAEFLSLLIEKQNSDLPYSIVEPAESGKQFKERTEPIVLALRGCEGSDLEDNVVSLNFNRQSFGRSPKKEGVLATVTPVSGFTAEGVAELEQTLVTYLTPTLNCRYVQRN